MVTIKMMGGLGNQMFQYALYRAFNLKGIDVCLDDYTYFKLQSPPPHLAYHLDIFDLSYKQIDSKTLPFYLNPQSRLYWLFRRLPWQLYLYREKEYCKYDPNVFLKKNRNKYFEGYWQTDKYFAEYKDVLKQDFTYKGEWTPSNSHYRELMLNSNSVSFHVRRGDYLKYDNYQEICTEHYYEQAICYLKSKLDNPTFFIFSNDLEWCKMFFGKEDNVVYIEGNDVEHSYMDMILMTYCKHHVIANSTFSWWGAWLSREEGITIVPSKWFQNYLTPDVWCENWIKMS